MSFSSESNVSLAILLNSAKIFYTLAFMPMTFLYGKSTTLKNGAFMCESCGKKSRILPKSILALNLNAN